MSDQRDEDEPYLWDRSGEPDRDVAKLEALLAPLAHADARVPLPTELPASRTRRRPFVRAAVGALALAAALAIGFFAGRSPIGKTPEHESQARILPSKTPSALGAETSPPLPGVAPPCVAKSPPEGALRYSVLIGNAVCDGGAAPGTGFLPLGTWLETDGSSRVMLEVADIGRVEIAPRSKLRILRGHGDEHRLELAHGVLHARINAPPRLFVVETAAATAVDLGCVYTLEVGDDGRGLLMVSRGEVALEKDKGSVVVEHGQMAEMRPGHRPGTPFGGDTSVDLRRALGAWDFDGASLAPVLSASTPGDALTLVGVLDRAATSADRVATFEKIGSFVPLPKTIERDAIASGDTTALDAVRKAVTAKR